MKYTVNRDSGKGKSGGRTVEGGIDCVASLGCAGKGSEDTRTPVAEKRRKGWERIWGAVTKK